MRIEELVIEGFKSYPSRTTITGWDPSFNAITGLNGTGKSNILDAISFVLGLTDYKELRAANQQELIYKKGAAGITKASVTIVFDNSDEANSPAGMQNLKQITVTRQACNISVPNKSRYLINGHVAQQQAVQSLFQSVQLNINNPNFVIRQGKITKVLNMGPREILGLIEEASGTRMYEERKEKALKTISKKEKKVEEITSAKIDPKLFKLRKERESYQAYTEASSKAESLGRIVSAYQYTDYNQRIRERENEIENANTKVADMQQQRKDRIKERKKAVVEQDEVKQKRDAEMQKDGKLKALEEDMANREKEVAKVQAQVEIVESTIKENRTKAEEVQEALDKMRGSLEESRNNVATINAEFTTAKEAHVAAQHSLSTAEELQQTLLTGLSSNANMSTGGYLGGIAEARSRAATAGTEIDQAKVQLGMTKTDMKEKESRARKMESEGQQGKDALERGRAEIAQLTAKLEKCGWNQQMKKESDDKMGQAREMMSRARDVADRMRNGLSNLDFSYSDPTPNFDRTSVLGYIANLTRLAPEVADKWSTALEICAGGKLYHVVVRDERVGSSLLKNGQLRKRVTLIPLTRISPPRTSPEAIAKAKRLAPGKVFLAIELVKYPPEAKAALEFVFGDTLICEDDETAKAVTFDPQIRMRSVTKSGSVYDPSGTLSGGSAPSTGGILKRVQEVQAAEDREREARKVVEQLRAEEEGARAQIEVWERVTRELELKNHQLGVLEAQVGGSDSARIHKEVDEMKRSITQLEATIASATERKKEAEAEATKLEKDMKEFGQNKESKLKELKADIVKKRSDVAKKSAKFKELQKEHQVVQMELEQMDADIVKAEEEVATAQAAIVDSEKQTKKLKAKQEEAEANRQAVATKLEKERAALKAYQQKLDQLSEDISAIDQRVSDLELALKASEHEIAGLAKEQSVLETKVADLEKLNPWFGDEKRKFGQPGTDYDFAAKDMNKIKDEAKKAEELTKGMKRKVNTKVMNLIEGVEKKDKELQERIAMVQKDKLKIESTIQELDREKLAALEKTFTKVNEQFGQIFAELLPSNFAKLQPPEGKALTEGLEVKVRLGQVWKQSLTELSGGQRSLIALSLIMALLQFKPAPMYILDEIDAALDLSHTQHIGTLFRNRFRGSQFVVVSLKEGLFTNANVLFRTRFRDNTSIVERTAQRSTSAMYSAQAEGSAAGRNRARGQARAVAGQA
ncbi:Structural maintenance of chromosomes protein 2 [Ceratobasidium sp. 395]|nr:Structural maintenance of chromosomes protein 2 [Ceratobasidium sp. 395]